VAGLSRVVVVMGRKCCIGEKSLRLRVEVASEPGRVGVYSESSESPKGGR
jgi:hypothetical protein